MLIRSALSVLVLSAVVACGGSDGPTTPTQTAPTISAQPADLTVDVGASAAFSVVASGSPPLAYQWKRGGAPIAGATLATFTLMASAEPDDGAGFSVEVSNAVGRAESRVATLRVRTAPRITAEPVGTTTAGGVPATFDVAATGSDVTYAWFRNGVAVPGATTRTYTVGVPLPGDDGAVYSATVTNTLGSVTSAGATLRVDAGPGLRSTSYANSKGRNRSAAAAPGQQYEPARAFAGFFGAEGLDFFLATQVYEFADGPVDAPRGEFQFWRWTGTEYVRATGAVTGDVGCVHPRKAAVADFNADGRPDVFVACHGYDQPPFPGEPNYVVLSQPDGAWVSRAVGSAGFYHNVTAFDVNGDGNTDAVITDNFDTPAVAVFVGDGNGGFTHRTDLLNLSGPYFTVEAADVNGDGRTDVLAGGHDWEGAETVVLLSDGSGTFANVTPRVIPRVPNEGVVLDFTVLDADRDGVNEIYVDRTSGGDGTFYQSRTVQKVLWPSLTADVLLSERGQPWIPFLLPVFRDGQYHLVGNVASSPFDLPLG